MSHFDADDAHEREHSFSAAWPTDDVSHMDFDLSSAAAAQSGHAAPNAAMDNTQQHTATAQDYDFPASVSNVSFSDSLHMSHSTYESELEYAAQSREQDAAAAAANQNPLLLQLHADTTNNERPDSPSLTDEKINHHQQAQQQQQQFQQQQQAVADHLHQVQQLLQQEYPEQPFPPQSLPLSNNAASNVPVTTRTDDERERHNLIHQTSEQPAPVVNSLFGPLAPLPVASRKLGFQSQQLQPEEALHLIRESISNPVHIPPSLRSIPVSDVAVELDLSINDLEGSVAFLEPLLQAQVPLTSLTLNHNRISDINLIASFGSSLTVISVSHNALSFIENVFRLCPSLTELDLSYNQITSIQGSGIALCSSLKRLALNSNRLRRIDELAHHSALERLDLRNNLLGEADATLHVLSTLPKLERLAIEGNAAFAKRGGGGAPTSRDTKQQIMQACKSLKFLEDEALHAAAVSKIKARGVSPASRHGTSTTPSTTASSHASTAPSRGRSPSPALQPKRGVSPSPMRLQSQQQHQQHRPPSPVQQQQQHRPPSPAQQRPPSPAQQRPPSPAHQQVPQHQRRPASPANTPRIATQRSLSPSQQPYNSEPIAPVNSKPPSPRLKAEQAPAFPPHVRGSSSPRGRASPRGSPSPSPLQQQQPPLVKEPEVEHTPATVSNADGAEASRAANLTRGTISRQTSGLGSRQTSDTNTISSVSSFSSSSFTPISAASTSSFPQPHPLPIHYSSVKAATAPLGNEESIAIVKAALAQQADPLTVSLTRDLINLNQQLIETTNELTRSESRRLELGRLAKEQERKQAETAAIADTTPTASSSSPLIQSSNPPAPPATNNALEEMKSLLLDRAAQRKKINPSPPAPAAAPTLLSLSGDDSSPTLSSASSGGLYTESVVPGNQFASLVDAIDSIVAKAASRPSSRNAQVLPGLLPSQISSSTHQSNSPSSASSGSSSIGKTHLQLLSESDDFTVRPVATSIPASEPMHGRRLSRGSSSQPHSRSSSRSRLDEAKAASIDTVVGPGFAPPVLSQQTSRTNSRRPSFSHASTPRDGSDSNAVASVKQPAASREGISISPTHSTTSTALLNSASSPSMSLERLQHSFDELELTEAELAAHDTREKEVPRPLAFSPASKDASSGGSNGVGVTLAELKVENLLLRKKGGVLLSKYQAMKASVSQNEAMLLELKRASDIRVGFRSMDDFLNRKQLLSISKALASWKASIQANRLRGTAALSRVLQRSALQEQALSSSLLLRAMTRWKSLVVFHRVEQRRRGWMADWENDLSDRDRRRACALIATTATAFARHQKREALVKALAKWSARAAIEHARTKASSELKTSNDEKQLLIGLVLQHRTSLEAAEKSTAEASVTAQLALATASNKIEQLEYALNTQQALVRNMDAQSEVTNRAHAQRLEKTIKQSRACVVLVESLTRGIHQRKNAALQQWAAALLTEKNEPAVASDAGGSYLRTIVQLAKQLKAGRAENHNISVALSASQSRNQSLEKSLEEAKEASMTNHSTDAATDEINGIQEHEEANAVSDAPAEEDEGPSTVPLHVEDLTNLPTPPSSAMHSLPQQLQQPQPPQQHHVELSYAVPDPHQQLLMQAAQFRMASAPPNPHAVQARHDITQLTGPFGALSPVGNPTTYPELPAAFGHSPYMAPGNLGSSLATDPSAHIHNLDEELRRAQDARRQLEVETAEIARKISEARARTSHHSAVQSHAHTLLYADDPNNHVSLSLRTPFYAAPLSGQMHRFNGPVASPRNAAARSMSPSSARSSIRSSRSGSVKGQVDESMFYSAQQRVPRY